MYLFFTKTVRNKGYSYLRIVNQLDSADKWIAVVLELPDYETSSRVVRRSHSCSF